MVVGESGLGKSTLINTLFNCTLCPPKNVKSLTKDPEKTIEIKSLTSEIEENGVKLKLTVVDTPGFGDFVNNDDRYVERPGDREKNLPGGIMLETYIVIVGNPS